MCKGIGELLCVCVHTYRRRVRVCVCVVFTVVVLNDYYFYRFIRVGVKVGRKYYMYVFFYSW